MKEFLFGYGSIINLISAKKTLGREIPHSEVTTAKLKNFTRIWGIAADVMVDGHNQNKPIHAAFYDLQGKINSTVNGVIIEVNAKELDDLDDREKQYNRIDVTKNIVAQMDYDKVYAYIGKKKFSVKNFKNVIILKEYQKIVDEGEEYWGKLFEKKFNLTTQIHSFKIMEGRYSFLDQKQNILTGHNILSKN